MKKSTRKLILSLRHARQVSSKPSKMDRPYAYNGSTRMDGKLDLLPTGPRYYTVKYGTNEFAFYGIPNIPQRTSLVLPEFQAAMKPSASRLR